MSSPAAASGPAAASQTLIRMWMDSYLNEHQLEFGYRQRRNAPDGLRCNMRASFIAGQSVAQRSMIQCESLLVLLLEVNLSQLRHVESMVPRHFVRCICRGSVPELLVFRK